MKTAKIVGKAEIASSNTTTVVYCLSCLAQTEDGKHCKKCQERIDAEIEEAWKTSSSEA